MKSVLPILLYVVPEAFLLILTALGLLGLKVKLGRLVLTGLGLSLITELSRRYLFQIGMHTPVILIGLTLLLVWGFRLSVTTAVTGCFLSFFLLLMGESLLASPVLSWTKITYQATLSNPWLHVAFGWLSAGFLVVATLVCHVGGAALIRAPETRGRDAGEKEMG